MKTLVQQLERFLEYGGIKKDITLLIISGISLIISIFDLVQLPFDAAWVAIILCGMLFLIPLSTILSCTHGLNVSTQNIEMAVLTLQ